MEFKAISTIQSVFKCESRRIGFFYLASCALFLLIGSITALVLQIDRLSGPTHLVNPQLFGQLLTQHGMIMVFVFLLPLITGTLGNLALPSAVGARNLAMPKLNLFGWICHLVGGILVIATIELGAYTSGWTMLMPPGASSGIFGVLIVGLALCAVSVLLQNLSILRTIASRRHRSIEVAQLPLFVWFFLFGAIVQVLATPVRLVTLALTMAAQNGATSALSLLDATSIVRYQQLFWLYAGPAIMATILPAIGVTFEVLAAHGGKAFRSRTKLVSAGAGLTMLILASWGQHLITAPDQEKLAAIGSLFSALTVVPILLIVFNCLGMMVQIRNSMAVPLTFLWLQIIMMILSALISLLFAVPALGTYLRGTYVTVAYHHIILLGTVFTSFLAGLFHWLPVLCGREFPRRTGYMVVAALFAGIVTTFVPMLLLGIQGSPKALHTYPQQFQLLHIISSAGAILLVGALLLGMAVAIRSYFRQASALIDQKPVSLYGEFSYSKMAVKTVQRHLL